MINDITLMFQGDPTTPKCGFSRQTIEILNGLDAQFGSFDILTDEKVRQELKTFSNWPTYPQVILFIDYILINKIIFEQLCQKVCFCILKLYINGEFVGGLDIIKEMVESNELQPMLPKKAKSLEQRMKDLINNGNVMVFMKGNRNEPRCGFSRTLMEILLGKLLNVFHLTPFQSGQIPFWKMPDN